MARDADGNLVSPVVGRDDTKITEEHHAEHLDVARMAQMYVESGLGPPDVVYGDTTESVRSLQEALDRIELARDKFERMPARVRELALNNPVRLEEMLGNEQEVQKLVDAGLQVEGFLPSQPPTPDAGDRTAAGDGPTEPQGDPASASAETSASS